MPSSHLIVAHEVTNIGSDRAQLTQDGDRRPRGRWDKHQLQAIADRGYFNGTGDPGL